MFMSYPLRIHPENQQTVEAFVKMLDETPEDRPKVEMNDESARNIEIIWESIKDLAAGWRGNKDMHVPKDPIDRKEYWGVFARENREILPVLKEFIEKTDGKGKLAIDLGCGNSPAAALLLKKGWRVIAVDYASKALAELIQNNRGAYDAGQLTAVEADVTAFTTEEPADLVMAVDVLSYIDPAKFQTTWAKIHDMLIKPQGVFIGTLFRSLPFKSVKIRDGINTMRERGAWFLPDRRMVRPLLTHMGYEVETCRYRQDIPGPDQTCIQFVAKKLNGNLKQEEKAQKK